MTDPCPIAMRGIVPSLNTPFTEDDRLDEPGIGKLVDATVASGAVGMLVLAFAGEQGSLSAAERERAINLIVARNAKRIPVVMSVTSADVAASTALAQVARAAGADGVCWQSPAGLDDAAVMDGAARIADAGFVEPVVIGERGVEARHDAAHRDGAGGGHVGGVASISCC